MSLSLRYRNLNNILFIFKPEADNNLQYSIVHYDKKQLILMFFNQMIINPCHAEHF